jgi:hypothetical protein
MAPRGLGNPGNLCYALAYLQLLAVTNLFQIEDTVQVSARASLFSYLEAIIAYCQGKHVVNQSYPRQRTSVRALISYLKKIISGIWPDISIEHSQEIIELIDKIHSHAWQPFGSREEEFQTSIKAVEFNVRKCSVCNNAVTKEMQESSNLLMFASLETPIENENVQDFAREVLGPCFNVEDQEVFCDRCQGTQAHHYDKKISSSQYPSILHISAQRLCVEANGTYFNNVTIKFPFHLNMTEYFDGENQCNYVR